MIDPTWSDQRVKDDLLDKLPEGARVRMYLGSSGFVGEVSYDDGTVIKAEALGYGAMLRTLWCKVVQPVGKKLPLWSSIKRERVLRPVAVEDTTALPEDLDPETLASLVEERMK